MNEGEDILRKENNFFAKVLVMIQNIFRRGIVIYIFSIFLITRIRKNHRCLTSNKEGVEKKYKNRIDEKL